MAKIGAELSITMHIGPASANEYAKFRVSIDDIDTDRTALNVGEQIQDALSALRATMDAVSAEMDRQIENQMRNQ